MYFMGVNKTTHDMSEFITFLDSIFYLLDYVT